MFGCCPSVQGEWVEAQYDAGNTWYKGQVKTVHPDCVYDISFPDGGDRWLGDFFLLQEVGMGVLSSHVYADSDGGGNSTDGVLVVS